MRNPPDEPASHAIVPRAERALANRSSALVQRTLADCKQLAAQREELDRLREMIRHDIDQCEHALMRGASAVSYLKQVCGERLPDWWRAAKMGWPEGQCLLGYCSWAGLNMKQDYAQAVDLFAEAAEQGQAIAQYALGLRYFEGKGVAQDYAKAVRWVRKAAERGLALAQCSLGFCYFDGEGVAQDYAEAAKWYRKAADQGNALAQCSLGFCYFDGIGVAQEYAEAVRWYRKAAEQGETIAQCALGWRYYYGEGVAQDYAEAVRWYRKAADQGHAPALDALREINNAGNRMGASSSFRASTTDQSATADERSATLATLARLVSVCAKCSLCETRTKAVFGDGHFDARLVFVGEAPGGEEDQQGVPFVGRAGQLLTDIITKGMRLRREEVYICNVIKCQPPNNRDPKPAEIEQCEPYLVEQLGIIQPEVICTLGPHAARTLLRTTASLGKLRGQWHEYSGIPLRVTYHPAYLLLWPADKPKAWKDIKIVMQRLGLPRPS